MSSKQHHALTHTVISHLENVLQCPISGQPLSWMSDEQLQRMNAEAYFTQYQSDDDAKVELTSGFITPDEKIVYPVEAGIVLATRNFAFVHDSMQNQSDRNPITYSEMVRDFYENFGWEKSEDGVYKDTVRHLDLRPVVRDYIHRCLMRVKTHLPERGIYLLDIASGPVAFQEHQTYSDDYDIRICVDLTMAALVEAQNNVPDGRGIFILGDIVNLPLKSHIVDAVVSMHTLYHVPADNQKTAFDELYRVLQPFGKGIVVYSWGRHHLLWHLFVSPIFFMYQVLKTLLKRSKQAQTEPQLYFHAHTWHWFLNQDWDFEWHIHSWRSLSAPMLRLYFWPFLGGKTLLRIIFWLEDRYPVTMGRIGQYPLLMFEKPPEAS